MYCGLKLISQTNVPRCAYRVKLLRSIGKCEDTTSPGSRSSTKWIGAYNATNPCEAYLSQLTPINSAGANPYRIVNQIRQKLRMPAAAVQIPIGSEDKFRGVVDLVRWKAIYNEGVKGYVILNFAMRRRPQSNALNSVVVRETDEIPADLVELATQKRQELVEALADVDDVIADLYLAEEPVTSEDLVAAIRRATIATKFSPVFVGSAIKNTGIQTLLDGVCTYLPNPSESEVTALDTTLAHPESAPVPLSPAAAAPVVGLAFKLEEGRFGQLTYMRMYQGTLKKGAVITNVRTGKKIKVPRLVKMHSDDMEVRPSCL